jgi:uncharacterized protein (TIGR01777 family)
MRVAVTGASGLIGSALTSHLEGSGHTVLPVVRTEPRPGVSAIRWNPAQGQIDAAALEGLDGVVHLAGAGIGDRRWSAAHRRAVLDSRVQGTRLLAGTLASLHAPPRVLVSGSAIGYYGDRGDEELTEVSTAGDGFLADVCRAWEAEVAPAHDAGIRVPRIRTGLVVSRRGGFMGRLLRLFRLGLGGRLGAGDQWWSWITLEDEVRAIAFLLESDVAGPVNVVAPNPVTNRQFTAALAQVLHRPAVVAVPAFGPRLLLGRQMADELLFASQRVKPAALLAAGFEFSQPELEPALRSVLG